MRRAARTDANQSEIVAYARALGASVVDLSGVGRGVPDLLIGVPGANDLWEIKDGKQPTRAQKLTRAEFEFHERYRGPCCIVRSLADARERLDWLRKTTQR